MHSHLLIYHWYILYFSYIFCFFSVSGLCVTLCHLFSSFSFSPVPPYNFCLCPAASALFCFSLELVHLSFPLFIYLSFQFVPTCFFLTLLPSLALFSSFPSFAPSLRLSVWHRVSQSPWWCAPCTLPPHTVLPPSCVNMPVIWAAPPCAESWVGGLKETEPS